MNTVSGILSPIKLNLRTDREHVVVSMLGKILSTTLLPLKSDNLKSRKSLSVKLKSGAIEPIAGKSPAVSTDFLRV
jgi:hypothetical protein